MNFVRRPSMLSSLSAVFVAAAILAASVGIAGLFARSADAQTPPQAPPTATGGDIVGHIITGYQGWFVQPGDGSPIGGLPAGTGNYHDNFETYPDMREFPAKERFAAPRGWPALPDGSPAALFASDRDFTADLHVRWMREADINVAAIQRFGEVVSDGRYGDQKNEVIQRMQRAFERRGGKFYIEYDASGSAKDGFGPDIAAGIENDWVDFAVGHSILHSPAYARQNGKPVVELWGMGLNGNNIVADPTKWRKLIDWFKGQGVYVIAGTPTYWRTANRDALPGFTDVYAACDAINPWVVGRFGKDVEVDRYVKDTLTPDLAWCRAHKIDLIPCVYPGTAFSNSNHNPKSKNAIPRRAGALLWRQFADLRAAGISTCFVSMFDEFNEATAIAKTAENASMIPAGTYFLTLDADGVSLSSDFYLRLTRDGAAMLKGKAPLRWEAPTAHR